MSLHLFLHLVLERRRRLLLHNSACAFLCKLHGKIEELNLEVIFSYISIYLSLFSLSFKNRCHFCRNETFSVRSRSCSLLSSIVAQSLEKGPDNVHVIPVNTKFLINKWSKTEKATHSSAVTVVSAVIDLRTGGLLQPWEYCELTRGEKFQILSFSLLELPFWNMSVFWKTT